MDGGSKMVDGGSKMVNGEWWIDPRSPTPDPRNTIFINHLIFYFYYEKVIFNVCSGRTHGFLHR